MKFLNRVTLILLFLIATNFTVLIMIFPGDQKHRRAPSNPKMSQAKVPWISFQPSKNQRIVILGAGPTGLGAAYRLYELGILHSCTQVVILDREEKAGGLASSYRDDHGFLWDNGGHVVFSHYEYFDNLLDKAVSSWNWHKRASFAFMKGSSGKRKFIPYPVQDNVMSMDFGDQKRILKDLKYLIAHPINDKPNNFDEWLLKNFGKELTNHFMRRYNRKVWTVDPKEMNAVWVGERVAVPSMEKIKQNAAQSGDSQWGPNRLFRFPGFHGTGGIWSAVADLLPRGWFHFGHEVSSVDITNKRLKININKRGLNTFYDLSYDVLINTSPLDKLINMDMNNITINMKHLAEKLIYSHTHIIGIGLKGQAPKHLSDKSWMYFPDKDSPFYRVTVFSKYSNTHVPEPGSHWSLMCEAAQPKGSDDAKQWTKEILIEETVSSLVKYGFINRSQVVSQYYRVLEHGYPVPSLQREQILTTLQPWLESHGIFSRGRFGGWRYEVGNQDHSLMQGVEVADWLIREIPEETYHNPSLVNSMKGSNRIINNIKIRNFRTNYEVVAAHFDENLDWLLAEASHVHVYHKGKRIIPDLRFNQWETLPNVGRESHTYLHHIIQNYDRLSYVTVFIQAGTNADHANNCYTNITHYVKKASKSGYAAKRTFVLDAWGRIPHHGKWLTSLSSGKMRRSNYTLGQFWDVGLGIPHPPVIRSSLKGCFAVTRDRIHFRSLSTYKKLISFINDHPNPEEGHYFERMWHGIFLGS